jgi:hypothetical protein
MLNLKNGVAVAFINGGNFDDEILYVDPKSKPKINDIGIMGEGYVDDDDDNSDDFESDEDDTDDLLEGGEEEWESDSGDNEFFGSYLKLTNGEFEPIFDESSRQVYYIAGKSNSGKSTFAGKLAKKFKVQYPGKPIYIFSMLDNDPALEGFGAYRIKIDQNLIDNPIDIQSELKGGSLVIFDDITAETFTDAKLNKEIQTLKIKILEYGRKNNINCIITSHLINPNDRKFGRIIMNELTKLVIFPNGSSAHPAIATSACGRASQSARRASSASRPRKIRLDG